MYDYFVTGRKEVAIETLEAEKKFLGLKAEGEKLCKFIFILSQTVYLQITLRPANVCIFFACK